MRRILFLLCTSLALVATSEWLDATAPTTSPSQRSSAAVPGADSATRFAGAWKLVSIERLGPKGDVLPPALPAPLGTPIGMIVYDPAGYMAVDIMQPGRRLYAGAQPTPEEAREALASYTSYFGTFTVNEAEGTVTHHLQGSLNPGMGADQKRFFELSGNRLSLKPPAGPTGAQSRLTWERLPDVPNLTSAHRRFVGFWKLVTNERRRPNGEGLSSNPGQTGFIVYTASGHMGAHLMQPGRKAYAAARPTPEEAMAALSTYTSYFGPYTIHESDGFVVHHRVGIVNPSQVGSDAQRFYEHTGRRLILKPPSTLVLGQPVQGMITWERLSADTGSSR